MYPTIEYVARKLATGDASSQALTEAALARAHDKNGEGSRVFTLIDDERALASARASDMLRAAGIVRSPLEGIPLSVKDLFDVAGQVTTAGSVVLSQASAATHSAPAIERLIAAGAVIVGRTNMTEFAYSGLGLNPHYGTPKNPWSRVGGGKIPGGSSSGAAVSVTDGMAVVGIGSDTGGSVRIPSALCGLTGFKPTQKRVPINGTVPLSSSLDSIGPLAASVTCCAIVDSVLSGSMEALSLPRSVQTLNLLIPIGVALSDCDDVVADVFERACNQLVASGARIDRSPIPAFERLSQLNARGTLVSAEAWAWHRELLERRLDDYDPRVGVRIEGGRKMGAADYIQLLHDRRDWIAEVESIIAPYDALLLPTVPIVAPPINELLSNDEAYFKANSRMLRNPTFINFLDGCALSLPCHRNGEAPVGIMLAASGGRDRELLSVGLSVEQALMPLRRD